MSGLWVWVSWMVLSTANLHTKILDFREFYSSIILILRGGILMSMVNFPESLSQRILVGIIIVGRLGVNTTQRSRGSPRPPAEDPLDPDQEIRKT